MLIDGKQIKDGSISIGKLDFTPGGGAFSQVGALGTTIYNSQDTINPTYVNNITNSMILRSRAMGSLKFSNATDSIMIGESQSNWIVGDSTYDGISYAHMIGSRSSRIDQTTGYQLNYTMMLNTQSGGIYSTTYPYTYANNNIFVGGIQNKITFDSNYATANLTFFLAGTTNGIYTTATSRNAVYTGMINSKNVKFRIPSTQTNVTFLGVQYSTSTNITADLSHTVLMPKLILGRGTSGSLPTSGETHSLGYVSTTGAVVRIPLSGAIADTANQNWYLRAANTFTTVQSPTYCLNLGYYTQTWGGDHNTIIGLYNSNNQTQGVVNYNTTIGMQNDLRITANTGLNQKIYQNFVLGYGNSLRNQTTTGANNVIQYNAVIGKSHDIFISGSVAGNTSQSNTLLGANVHFTISNGSYINGNFVGGDTLTLHSTDGYGFRDNIIFDSGHIYTTDGYVTDSVIIGNAGLTSNTKGSLYNAVLIGNKSISQMRSVWESCMISNETITITGGTQRLSNSAVIASRSFVNAGYKFWNSGLIAVDGYTMTADLYNTVVLPKLKLGKGTGGALPTSGAEYLLGISSSGNVSKLTLADPLPIFASDFDTAVTTGVSKGYGSIPFDCNIVDIKAQCLVSGPTGGSFIVDVNLNGSTIMDIYLGGRKIEIETGETDSDTATNQPILTTVSASRGDVITVDFDTVNGTIKGVEIWIYIEKTA